MTASLVSFVSYDYTTRRRGPHQLSFLIKVVEGLQPSTPPLKAVLFVRSWSGRTRLRCWS